MRPPVFLESPRGLEVLGLLFTIWMIVDCWRRPQPPGERMLWLLALVFLPLFGPLAYFLLRVARVRG
jgi:hypothetical protein